MEKKGSPYYNMYAGDLAEPLRKLGRAIRFNQGSLLSELRPAIMALFKKYGVEVTETKEESKKD